MSVYETTVNNFIHLLKTQSSLFSEPDRLQLSQLIDSQSDEIKALSNAISDWCLNHPQVDDALAQIEEEELNIEEEELNIRAPGIPRANTKIPRYKHDKKRILNVIQQSSSFDNNAEKNTSNN